MDASCSPVVGAAKVKSQKENDMLRNTLKAVTAGMVGIGGSKRGGSKRGRT